MSGATVQVIVDDDTGGDVIILDPDSDAEHPMPANVPDEVAIARHPTLSHYDEGDQYEAIFTDVPAGTYVFWYQLERRNVIIHAGAHHTIDLRSWK